MIDDSYLPIDHLFAQRICPESAPFLAYLLKSAREGHMCVYKNTLPLELRACAENLPARLFERFLRVDGERIYLKRNWICEQKFLADVKRLKDNTPLLDISSSWVRERLKTIPLNNEQKEAIERATQHTLTLITGGPGCGKTYTAAKLIELFVEYGLKNVIIAAPTGKATANLRHALGDLGANMTIKTIHALVHQKQIYADLVVVDEASMVDAERMQKLFSAVQQGTRLVLLGDPYQLPPIESGSFFADLAHDESVNAQLKTCLRTELVEIVEMAACVKEGRLIDYLPLPDLQELLKFVMQEEIQILTPLRHGLFGVDHLNEQLYRLHQKKGSREIPIMITVNDAHADLFNGDCGRLCLDEKRAYFSAGRVKEAVLLPLYEYAYALSVHKSQGSEYESVAVLLPKGSETFGREMLYTAITRAKKRVIVFAHDGVMEALLAQTNQRLSGIKEKMVSEERLAR